MTISSTTTRVSYNGNGATTAFSFPYLFYENGDLTVILVSSAGVETVKTITTHYTVTGAGLDAGGTVTMLTAPASGEKLVILREVDYDQQDFDPQDNDPFPAASIEEAVDKVVMMAQQLKEISDRSLKFPRGDSSGLTSQIPAAATRATRVLGFDSSGNIDVSSTVTLDDLDDLADDAAAAAASATAAAASASSASASAAAAAASAVTAQNYSGSGLRGSVTPANAATTITVSEAVQAGLEWTVEILRNGLPQVGGDDYTANGTTTLTFTSAFDGTEVVKWVHKGGDNSVAELPPDGSVTAAKITNGASEQHAIRAKIGAQRQAAVTMRWGANSGAWTVYDETGAEIDISASTTDGLQEAIDYACEYGRDLFVYGGGHRTSDGSMPATITCTTGIDWPSMQGQTIWFGGVDILFTGVGADAGFHFDSCMGVHFHFAGEIQYAGSGDAVLFEPRNNVPLDANTVIVDSDFYFHTIGSLGTSCVKYKPTSGGIGRCFWKFVEVIDGANGVVLEDGSHETTQNIMQFVGIHDQQAGGASLKVGSGTSGRVTANLIDFGVNATGNTAVEVYGKNNRLRGFIEAQSGTTVGVHLRSSAENNRFEMQKNACTTPVTDDSTTKDNYGMYAGPVPRANVELASDQTIAHNTWTKLALATEIFDKGGKFDAATNYRWTPGRTGEALITAKVGYFALVDGTPLWIAIYRNGSIYRSEREAARDTATEQGASITELVPVTATTDYFEIYVRQDSGGSVDAAAGGAGQFTSASFVMLD